MKRAFDFFAAVLGLTLLAPVLAVIAGGIWLADRGSPIFAAPRVGRDGCMFRMIKFRTMIPDAWKSGVNSTAKGDARITWVGAWLRKGKLDELPQLWNVLVGDMSLVGPRPQVPAEVQKYTGEESRMLGAKPGITDLASIVFSDESEILAGCADPDLLYNQIVRPWKSRLTLLYLENRTLTRDAQVLWLTAVGLFARAKVLRSLSLLVAALGGSEKLQAVAGRKTALEPSPPPGTSAIVSRCGAHA